MKISAKLQLIQLMGNQSDVGNELKLSWDEQESVVMLRLIVVFDFLLMMAILDGYSVHGCMQD